MNFTIVPEGEREWNIYVWPPRARIRRTLHIYEGIAYVSAQNWEQLEAKARDAVIRQRGSLNTIGTYACPDELVAQVRVEEIPEDDWIMQVDALQLLLSRGISYTYQGLSHAMDRGELDWLYLPHAHKQHGRRKVRRSQIMQLQLQRKR